MSEYTEEEIKDTKISQQLSGIIRTWTQVFLPPKSMLLFTAVYCITNGNSTSPFHQASRGYKYQSSSFMTLEK